MYRMILIDDEVSTLRLLPKALDWASFDIEICGTARNGKQGLELFRKQSPDIIIADIKMPEMDGLAFAQAVRASDKAVKIVLLSAYAQFDFARSAILLNIFDYLLKPLDERQLRDVITRMVSVLRREREPSAGTVSAEFYPENVFEDMQSAPVPNDLPPIDFSSFDAAMTALVEMAFPRPLVEQLSGLLRYLFERKTDPEHIYEVILDIVDLLKATALRCYGYRHGRLPINLQREQLSQCDSPDALLQLIERFVRDAARRLEALFALNPDYVVIRQAKEYVKQHYAVHALSLQQVADHVGMSKNYFSAVFHEMSGMKFWEYLTRLRIEAAKELLSTSILANSAICRKVGYESEYHFSRIFKRIVGTTPLQYRKRRAVNIGKDS